MDGQRFEKYGFLPCHHLGTRGHMDLSLSLSLSRFMPYRHDEWIQTHQNTSQSSHLCIDMPSVRFHDVLGTFRHFKCKNVKKRENFHMETFFSFCQKNMVVPPGSYFKHRIRTDLGQISSNLSKNHEDEIRKPK